MSVYDRIVQYIRAVDGRTVKSCWIADAKRRMGMRVRPAPNRLPGRQNPAPFWALVLIVEAILRLGLWRRKK